MPIDSRIEWGQAPRKSGYILTGILKCTVCDQEFKRELFVSNQATKEAVWNMKEDISYELSQHSHGKI